MTSECVAGDRRPPNGVRFAGIARKGRWPRAAVAIAGTLLLGACSFVTEDAGFGDVKTITAPHLSQEIRRTKTTDDERKVSDEIRQRLASPLSVDDAVQVALLNNRGLQAAYGELGIAESDLVQAGRIRNPGFRFSRASGGDVTEIDRQVIFDLLGLLTIPLATQIEERRFEQTKLRTARHVLEVAADTRRAYYRAVAAQESLKFMEQVKIAAEAAAELGLRMYRVGTWSRLGYAREQAFYAEAVVQVGRARRLHVAQRERLARLMGLWGDQLAFTLPDRLPDAPATVRSDDDLESAAIRDRLDLRMARLEIEGLARSLGLTRATRFIDVLETGYLRNSSSDAPRKTGYEIELKIPLFDWGDARVAKAEEIYMQAVNRLAEMAVNARSEVRDTYHAYRTAYELARLYREEIVPVRKTISEENQLRYNGMLVGVFDVLADAREQVMSVIAAIEAARDFWVSDADLQAALIGGSPAAGADEGGALAAPGRASTGGH